MEDWQHVFGIIQLTIQEIDLKQVVHHSPEVGFAVGFEDERVASVRHGVNPIHVAPRNGTAIQAPVGQAYRVSNLMHKSAR
jgi:hypothetical protein